MIVYFDSSSIVKWFFDESFSDLAVATKDEADMAFTSLLSFPEVLSAFNRAWREGRCSKSDMKIIRKEFERVWNDFRWIKVSESLIQRTGALIEGYSLRGYDAVQLASALLVKEANDGGVFFSGFDRTLNRAAKKEGLLIHQLKK